MQWRAAFGSTTWGEVLLAAAAGNGSYAYIAAAGTRGLVHCQRLNESHLWMGATGELLSGLLTERAPAGVDSVILTRREASHVTQNRHV